MSAPPPDPAGPAPGVLAPVGSPLRDALGGLAARARMVFLAGLPGTGKSLCLHQLCHLAHAAGRRLHLLQWDVARPVFERHPAGRPYPTERGVTHGVIRLAVGRWARAAVARWATRHPELEALLVGETPLAGHRLVELARPAPDAAEAVLAAPTTRFVIPVPSVAVRAHIEAERERRAVAPRHEREREDAPPEVLRDLWRQIHAAAVTLGLAAAPGPAPPVPPYDPAVYAAVYRAVLARRHCETLPLDTVLPTAAMSPYDLRVPREDLVPTPAEVARFIGEAAAAAPDPARLRAAIERWHEPTA